MSNRSCRRRSSTPFSRNKSPSLVGRSTTPPRSRQKSPSVCGSMTPKSNRGGGSKMGDGGENVRKSWDTVSTMSGASSFSASRIDDLPRELPPTALRDPKSWSNEVLIALQSRRSYSGWHDADLDSTGESIVFGCKKHFLCLQNLCIPKDSTDNKLAPSEEFPRCRTCHICESHETKMMEVLEQRQAYSENATIKIRQWEDWLPVRESLVEQGIGPDPDPYITSTEAKAFRMLRGIRLEAEQLVADAKAKAEKLRTGNDTTTMTNSMPKIEVSFGWFQKMLFRLGMGPDISIATIRRMYRKWLEPMTHGQRRRRSLEGRFVPHDHEVDDTMKTSKGYVLKRLDSGFLNEKLSFLTAERMILITTKLLDVWKVRADEQEDDVALRGLEQFSGVKAKTKDGDEDDAIVHRRTAASMSRSTTSSSLSGRATTQLGRQTTIRNLSPPKTIIKPPSSPNAFSMSKSKPKLRPSRTAEEIDDITQSVGDSVLRRTMLSTGLLLGPEEKEDSARAMDRWSKLRVEGNIASERGSLKDRSMAVFEEIGKSISARSLRRSGMASLSSPRSSNPRATSFEA